MAAGCAWGVASASQIPKRDLGRRGEVTPPYGSATGVRSKGASRPPPPTEAAQVVPSSGPMYLRHGFRRPNFVPKFGASVMGIGPYGKPDQPPKPAGAQRSARARVGEGWAGIGAKTIPKGGLPPRLPGQRLAKRKARKERLVKFSLCPISELCSTAYRVRKSDESPARAPVGAALIEQDRLAPHPAARQGAPRP